MLASEESNEKKAYMYATDIVLATLERLHGEGQIELVYHPKDSEIANNSGLKVASVAFFADGMSLGVTVERLARELAPVGGAVTRQHRERVHQVFRNQCLVPELFRRGSETRRDWQASRKLVYDAGQLTTKKRVVKNTNSRKRTRKQTEKMEQERAEAAKRTMSVQALIHADCSDNGDSE
jgi:hypothetical protein